MPEQFKGPLDRLVKRRHLEAVFAEFGALRPGLELALVGPDGAVVVGEERWAAGAAQTLLTTSAEPGQVHVTGGRLLFPLAVDGQWLGALIARDSPEVGAPAVASLLRAMGLALTLLFTEALVRRDLVQDTLERYQEINLLYRATKTFGSALDPGEIARLILDEVGHVVAVDVGAVLLNPAPDEPRPNVANGATIGAVIGPLDRVEAVLTAARPASRRALEAARPLIVELPADGRPTAGDADITMVLCAPLIAPERPLGVLVLGRRRDRPEFSAGDEKLVMALVDQAVIAMETARSHAVALEKQRLEEELAVGRRIQLSFLPQKVPEIPGWEFCAYYRAARQVGGDFYDFIRDPHAPDRVSLLIGDVTGKGVPAALFMASCLTFIRTETLLGHGPAEVLRRTNAFIVRERRHDLFLSALIGTLVTTNGRLTYASGGHDWPLWQRADRDDIEPLAAQGYLIGAFREPRLEEVTIDIAPGDQLLFFTDGITEARDQARACFGDERLMETMRRHRRAGAQQLVAAIVSALQTFSGDTNQADDLTFFAVKRR